MKVTIKTSFAELNLEMELRHVKDLLQTALLYSVSTEEMKHLASADQKEEPAPVVNTFLSKAAKEILDTPPYSDTNPEDTTVHDTATNKEAVSHQAEKPAAKSRAEAMFGKRETWNTPAADPKPEQTQKREAYGGFLHVKCEACGKVKSFMPKRPIAHFICECGSCTDLYDMTLVHIHCKCGNEYTYRTNRTEKQITMNCYGCGAPVDLELNGKGNAYIPIGWRK